MWHWSVVQISVRTRYALCALIDLNINQTTGNVKLKDVSERQNIPLKYLEQIIQALSKAGFVKGERGPNGGYVLSRPATTISVDDVLLALEGSHSLLSSFDPQVLEIESSAQFAVYSFWRGTESKLKDITANVSIGDLSKNVTTEVVASRSDEYYI